MSTADEDDIPVSIARGFAVYNPELHISYADIFDCADREMYVHKKIVKSKLANNISTRENK